ncbi:TetR/AcrR family transcriptional regulator C-terminal domain-containing protein [Deinococcus hopiensis]|uniref:Transcriptional regulator, TetR family n=1 Tax=Deinococcus hopiensis KR-140 TaxID=695939 RepID=A0A1W1VVV8_9DEIO|nr:TetR/AcrR family transcriptional regulator C-terminal domain-containing protein [Deinococcus hopiensis]SMB97499.1 transcriptional regulator, TetR family [Deinococcus hopiensis KR-140]
MTVPDLPNSEPRIPLTRERILRAALDLADLHGLEALSMRRLGQALGVEAMSLYKHIKDKDALIDGLIDLVIAEIDVPQGAHDWKDAMRRRAISAHQALLRHRWACSLMGSRVNIGPAMLSYLDRTFAWLRRGGFTVEQTLDAWHALDGHIYGFTLQQLNLPFAPEEAAQMAAAGVELIPADHYPHFHAVVTEIVKMGGRVERFEFGLDLILGGLERLLSASGQLHR